MRIITHTCSNCKTVIAGNVLEAKRVMECPGVECETVIRFDDLQVEDKEYFIKNKQDYEIN